MAEGASEAIKAVIGKISTVVGSVRRTGRSISAQDVVGRGNLEEEASQEGVKQVLAYSFTCSSDNLPYHAPGFDGLQEVPKRAVKCRTFDKSPSFCKLMPIY